MIGFFRVVMTGVSSVIHSCSTDGDLNLNGGVRSMRLTRTISKTIKVGSGPKEKQEGTSSYSMCASQTTTSDAETKSRSISLAHFFKAQSISSCFEGAALYSFDVARTRLQTQKSILPSDITGPRSVFTGIRSMYRGYCFWVISSIPCESTYRLTYETGSKRALLSPFFAGAIADGVSSLLWVPMDVVSQRLQISPVGVSAWSIVKGVWVEGGIRSFYRSLGISLVLYPPQSGCWWLLYEKGKAFGKERGIDSWKVCLPSGICAGVLCAILFNPLDVIKTRLQTGQAMEGCSSARELGRKLVGSGSMRWAMLGLGPAVLKAAVESSVMAGGYESVLAYARAGAG